MIQGDNVVGQQLVAHAKVTAYNDRTVVHWCKVLKMGLGWWRLVIPHVDAAAAVAVFVDVRDRVINVIDVDGDGEWGRVFDLVVKEAPAHEYPDVDFQVRAYIYG